MFHLKQFKFKLWSKETLKYFSWRKHAYIINHISRLIVEHFLQSGPIAMDYSTSIFRVNWTKDIKLDDKLKSQDT